MNEDDPIYDGSKVPPRTPEMEQHQVWVFMNGPGRPHWEVRGTGALVEPR